MAVFFSKAARIYSRGIFITLGQKINATKTLGENEEVKLEEKEVKQLDLENQ